jgi:hypothetical protein
LDKRRHLDDVTCLLCEENETTSHLFFKYCVASALWDVIADVTDYPKITEFLSMGKYWVLGKRHTGFNVCTSAVVWSLWKYWNNMCF